MNVVNSQGWQSRRLFVMFRTSWVQVSLVLAMSLALGACGKDEPVATDATAGVAAPVVPPEAAVSAKVSAMSAEDLREAARAAYAENRLYAPAEDNAVEYYLALRDKAPGDAAVSSALIDLLPMTVIATEQSVNRDDFAEAQRLVALLEKADAQHPALARLKSSIATRQQDAVKRAEQEALSAEEQREKQLALEKKRLEDQKAQQEAAAKRPEAPAPAPRPSATAATTAAAEKAAADQRAADQRAADQRATEQRAAQQRAAQQAAAPTAGDLRALSTPSPRFPPEALRAGQSGEVQVEFTVNTDGSVSDVRVVKATPARVFDREAIAAVRRWRFQPVSAPVTTRRTIGFNPGG